MTLRMDKYTRLIDDGGGIPQLWKITEHLKGTLFDFHPQKYCGFSYSEINSESRNKPNILPVKQTIIGDFDRLDFHKLNQLPDIYPKQWIWKTLWHLYNIKNSIYLEVFKNYIFKRQTCLNKVIIVFLDSWENNSEESSEESIVYLEINKQEYSGNNITALKASLSSITGAKLTISNNRLEVDLGARDENLELKIRVENAKNNSIKLFKEFGICSPVYWFYYNNEWFRLKYNLFRMNTLTTAPTAGGVPQDDIKIIKATEEVEIIPLLNETKENAVDLMFVFQQKIESDIIFITIGLRELLNSPDDNHENYDNFRRNYILESGQISTLLEDIKPSLINSVSDIPIREYLNESIKLRFGLDEETETAAFTYNDTPQSTEEEAWPDVTQIPLGNPDRGYIWDVEDIGYNLLYGIYGCFINWVKSTSSESTYNESKDQNIDWGQYGYRISEPWTGASENTYSWYDKSVDFINYEVNNFRIVLEGRNLTIINNISSGLGDIPILSLAFGKTEVAATYNYNTEKLSQQIPFYKYGDIHWQLHSDSVVQEDYFSDFQFKYNGEVLYSIAWDKIFNYQHLRKTFETLYKHIEVNYQFERETTNKTMYDLPYDPELYGPFTDYLTYTSRIKIPYEKRNHSILSRDKGLFVNRYKTEYPKVLRNFAAITDTSIPDSICYVLISLWKNNAIKLRDDVLNLLQNLKEGDNLPTEFWEIFDYNQQETEMRRDWAVNGDSTPDDYIVINQQAVSLIDQIIILKVYNKQQIEDILRKYVELNYIVLINNFASNQLIEELDHGSSYFIIP